MFSLVLITPILCHSLKIVGFNLFALLRPRGSQFHKVMYCRHQKSHYSVMHRCSLLLQRKKVHRGHPLMLLAGEEMELTESVQAMGQHLQVPLQS